MRIPYWTFTTSGVHRELISYRAKETTYHLNAVYGRDNAIIIQSNCLYCNTGLFTRAIESENAPVYGNVTGLGTTEDYRTVCLAPKLCPAQLFDIVFGSI